jgi:hypothetical protein
MGGECRDRTGIYVAGVDGRRAARLTNDCRVIGTERGDVITGTALADIIVGLGGNDRLRAAPRSTSETPSWAGTGTTSFTAAIGATSSKAAAGAIA